MPASLSFFQGDHPPHIGATVLDWISWPFWFSATNHRHHKKSAIIVVNHQFHQNNLPLP